MSVAIDWRSVTDRLSPLLDARRAPRHGGARLAPCDACAGVGRVAADDETMTECSACGGLGYDVGI